MTSQPQRNGVAPITELYGLPTFTPISAFLRIGDSVTKTISECQNENTIHIKDLIDEMD